MLLEFLAEGADECPLLRFYRWADGEVSLLRDAAEKLGTGAVQSVAVDRLPFMKALGGITFTWVADPHDRGVLMPRDARNFVMQLPSEAWADVAKAMQLFERSTIGFNWLLPVSEVEVLLSWSGQW
jgi:hypothetical protein